MRGKVIDSVNVLISFVIGTGKEVDSAFNQSELIAVGIQFGRIKNGVCKVVNESVVGVVGFGAVDDNGLKLLVPRLRFAEELAQVMLCFNGIKNEAFDELFGDVFVGNNLQEKSRCYCTVVL